MKTPFARWHNRRGAATLDSDRRLRQPSMAGEEPLLLGETCERSARYARYARDRRDLGETCEISARLHPPSTCERQGQRAQGWGWRCDAVRCDAVRCGAVRGVRLQKPQHVSRHGESERFPLHSSRHRPGRGTRAGWGGANPNPNPDQAAVDQFRSPEVSLRRSAQQRRFRHCPGTASVSWLIHLFQLRRPLTPSPPPTRPWHPPPTRPWHPGQQCGAGVGHMVVHVLSDMLVLRL